MQCPRCSTENLDSHEFCSRCGLDLAEARREALQTQIEGTHVCYRHPTVRTELSCGRCGRYLCPTCVIIGPAGPRCKECAKQNIAIRPTAVVFGLGQTLRNMARWSPYLTVSVILALLSMFGYLMRDCGHKRNSEPPIQLSESDESR